MNTTTRNEAAERLLLQWLNDVTFALAAERRATVERIRERFDFGPCHECDNSDNAYAALDEEATR